MKGKLQSNVRYLNSYVLIDKILHIKRAILEEKESDYNTKILNIVLPSTQLDKAITNVHFRHHTDAKHTLFKFRLKFYFLQERSMISKHIRNCDVCRILKGRVDVPIQIQNAPIGKQPFETVAIDFLGPLIATDAGNRYIYCLVLIYLVDLLC